MAQTSKQTAEQTLSIIKPDAVEQNQIGNIIEYFEREGLSIVAAKMLRLSIERAETFYAAHKSRPFFKELVDFMISGPVFVMVLEGEGAVGLNRRIMGPTDPEKAPSGTIRGDFATNIERNAIHGSDSPDAAREEISFFFKQAEICPRTP